PLHRVLRGRRTMTGQTMGEKVAEHGEWISNHEKRCEERYAGIQRSIQSIEGVLRALVKGAFGLLLAILGWLLVQLYNGNQARLAALDPPATPVTVVQSQTPAPKP